MSKNYDLYPKYERKIDNWRRRILGYEKMKRNMQRQIQILKNKNKRQKEVINKVGKILNECKLLMPHEFAWEEQVDYVLDILKEVSE